MALRTVQLKVPKMGHLMAQQMARSKVGQSDEAKVHYLVVQKVR